MVRNNLLAKIAQQGLYFLNQLKTLAREYPMIHQPRGRGLMLAFDLDVDGVVDYSVLSERFLAALLQRGCLLQAANAGRTMRVLPNYLIERTEFDLFIEAVRDVMADEQALSVDAVRS
jgi:4-aminobutyrate aminotransferase-like enzyme